MREGSRERLEELIAALGPRTRPHQARSSATCSEPKLGVDDDWIAEHKGTIDHFFHLAAIYDMTADDERNERLNVGGTAQRRRPRQRARAPAPCTTPPRSPPPALYKGLFREDMFDEGQKLPSRLPPHEVRVREDRPRARRTVPWRVYRPAVVVGHSQTGEMDKIDGPYYFFKAIQKLRDCAARVGAARRPGARLHEHRARSTTSPARWTTSPTSPTSTARPSTSPHPKGQRSGDVLNTFARAAHAPQMAMRIDKRLIDALPKGTSRCS